MTLLQAQLECSSAHIIWNVSHRNVFLTQPVMLLGMFTDLVLGLHILDQIYHSAAVPMFVIVPADQLDECRVELYPSLGIKYGGVGVSGEIRGHNLVLRVPQDSRQISL